MHSLSPTSPKNLSPDSEWDCETLRPFKLSELLNFPSMWMCSTRTQCWVPLVIWAALAVRGCTSPNQPPKRTGCRAHAWVKSMTSHSWVLWDLLLMNMLVGACQGSTAPWLPHCKKEHYEWPACTWQHLYTLPLFLSPSVSELGESSSVLWYTRLKQRSCRDIEKLLQVVLEG